MTVPGDSPLVCILGDGDGLRLGDAIASAGRFGLTVLVGASAGKPEGVATVDIDWQHETVPWYSLQNQDSEALTPRPITRLQRNDGTLCWRHAIHEMLHAVKPPHTPAAEPLAGAVLRHHSYGDDQTISAKLRRNQDIVAAERRQGRDYFYLWIEEARYAEAFGTGATMA